MAVSHVILSDIHLGSPGCQAGKVCEFLEPRVEADGDIIYAFVGDVFEDLNLLNIEGDAGRAFAMIRRLQKFHRVVFIIGNHDGMSPDGKRGLENLWGCEVLEEYVAESGGKRILVVHGHIWDRWIEDHPWLVNLADHLYLFTQRLHVRLAATLKLRVGQYRRMIQAVRDGALRRAGELDCHAACCGHTHYAEEDPVAGYYNAGCWVSGPVCNYLEIENGTVRLCAYV